MGVSVRRGRSRLSRVGRRRADGHRPGIRAGHGLRGDRAVLILRVRLGTDPRALLGPRGARAGRARGGLDDHAGRRGVPAGPARPRVQGQGLPGRAHRHEPRDPRGRRGRVDHLGGVPGGLARPDHRHLRFVERRQGPARDELYARRRARTRGPRNAHPGRHRRGIDDPRRHIVAAHLPRRSSRRPDPGRHASARERVASRDRVPDRQGRPGSPGGGTGDPLPVGRSPVAFGRRHLGLWAAHRRAGRHHGTALRLHLPARLQAQVQAPHAVPVPGGTGPGVPRDRRLGHLARLRAPRVPRADAHARRLGRRRPRQARREGRR